MKRRIMTPISESMISEILNWKIAAEIKNRINKNPRIGKMSNTLKREPGVAGRGSLTM